MGFDDVTRELVDNHSFLMPLLVDAVRQGSDKAQHALLFVLCRKIPRPSEFLLLCHELNRPLGAWDSFAFSVLCQCQQHIRLFRCGKVVNDVITTLTMKTLEELRSRLRKSGMLDLIGEEIYKRRACDILSLYLKVEEAMFHSQMVPLEERAQVSSMVLYLNDVAEALPIQLVPDYSPSIDFTTIQRKNRKLYKVLTLFVASCGNRTKSFSTTSTFQLKSIDLVRHLSTYLGYPRLRA